MQPMGRLPGSLSSILRLEEALLGAACIWLFAGTGFSWWLFAALLLSPDLTMLGYLAGPRAGAIVYNAGHSWLGPVLLAMAGHLAGSPLWFALACIWGAHIGLDRALGYGLKYMTGFGHTHLGPIGPAAKA